MKGLSLTTIALIFTSLAAVASPFAAFAVNQEKISQIENSSKSQWDKINKNTTDLVDLKIALTELRGDVKNLNSGQSSMLEILKEVRSSLKS